MQNHPPPPRENGEACAVLSRREKSHKGPPEIAAGPDGRWGDARKQRPGVLKVTGSRMLLSLRLLLNQVCLTICAIYDPDSRRGVCAQRHGSLEHRLLKD